MLSYGRLLSHTPKTKLVANATVTLSKRTKSQRYYPLLGQSYKNPKRVKEEQAQAALKAKMMESIKRGTYDEEKAEAEREAAFKTFVAKAQQMYDTRQPVSMIKALQTIRSEMASNQSNGVCKLNFNIAAPIKPINLKSQFNLKYDNGEVIKSKCLILVTDPKEVAEKYLNDKESYFVGNIDTLNEIVAGEFDVSTFQKCFAAASLTKNLGPAAKVLGPAGLMPSAKRGTVGKNINEVIEQNSSSLQRSVVLDTKGPEFLFKTIQVGDVNTLSDIQILENVITIRDEINKSIESHNANNKKNLIFLCSLTFESDKFEPIEIEYTKK